VGNSNEACDVKLKEAMPTIKIFDDKFIKKRVITSENIALAQIPHFKK
jgi:hypothetical protein